MIAPSSAWRTRCERAFRDTDLIARLGGDEFVVVAEAEADPDPEALSVRLDEALVEAGREVGELLRMSYGAVVTDWHGLEDADALLARADALMYEAKRARRAAEGGEASAVWVARSRARAPQGRID